MNVATALTQLIMKRPKFFVSITLIVSLLGVALLTGATGLTRSEAGKLKRETVMALNHLENYHFSKKRLTDFSAEEILINFMEELDYNHLFFLESEKDMLLNRFSSQLFETYLFEGDLYPAFEIFAAYKINVEERVNWVFKRLEGDFDFTTDKEYVFERSELDWPNNQQEADALWERRLHYELISEILNERTLDEAKEKVKRRYERTLKYAGEIEEMNIQETFVTSVAQMYDPHSTFFSADTLEEFSISMHNSLVGIGALLRDEDGICVIQELIAGGPAEMSGLLNPGDRIVEVAQGEYDEPVDVIDMKLSKIVKMIRGKKGTPVVLTIEPAEKQAGARKQITLIRDQIQLTENLAKAEVFEVPLGEKTVPIGLIELPSFYGEGTGENAGSSTTNDVEELIGKLKEIGVQGLVLDLRRNGGGLLSEAVSLTGLFITTGPVVQVKDTTGQVREDRDSDPKVAYDGPLVVLVSRRSASASEIVAGALQDHDRALIVGDTATHGKGTVQAVFELDRNLMTSLFASKADKYGAAKITIQKFYLPDGASTQKEGVRSHIALPSINDYLPIGEGDLDNAMKWDTIETLAFKPGIQGMPKWVTINDSLVDFLQKVSAERQQSHPEFQFLSESIDYYREQQEQTSVSLNLEKRRTEQEESEAFLDESRRQQEVLRRKGYKSDPVDLRISELKEAQHQEKLLAATLPDGSSRANRYFSKVFYHQPEGADSMEEIWVEDFNYEKLIDHTAELVEKVNADTGLKLSTPQMQAALEAFKEGDKSEDFLADRVFATHFGDAISEEQMPEVLSSFFRHAIEVDPYVRRDLRGLDIGLRESLRIMADWINYRDTQSKAVAKTGEAEERG